MILATLNDLKQLEMRDENEEITYLQLEKRGLILVKNTIVENNDIYTLKEHFWNSIKKFVCKSVIFPMHNICIHYPIFLEQY